jgi:sugar lactone lactonase YvrE
MKSMKSIAFIAALSLGILQIANFSYRALAQNLPPLYENTPEELAPAHSIARFPINTFLESIAIDDDGTLFITSHEEGKILRLHPNGTQSIHAEISGKIVGLAWGDRGALLVTGWDETGIPSIFKVSRRGKVKVLATLPDAMFLNGLTKLTGDRYLIADSYRGAIWELDARRGEVKIWLEHPFLARSMSENATPGVNGLKIFSEVLYASNSDKAHLVKIPLQRDFSAGEPKIFLDNAVIDDFAFDREGNLYGATHIFNSVVRISPEGAIAIIATEKQGVTGSTAVAFGHRESDRTSIYIVTNGGMFLPPATGIVAAEVVRLDVGIQGDF